MSENGEVKTEIGITPIKQDISENTELKLQNPNEGIEREKDWKNLDGVEKRMVAKMIEDEINKSPFVDKETIIRWIQREFNLDRTKATGIYRRAEKQYYQHRIPPETLINKINDESEYLKREVIENSALDITKQAKVINDINETMAKVNKLTDVPTQVQINISTDLNEAEFLSNFNKED